jgi:N-acetyl-anhydromuramyl-L-alanine amidase AmpD
MPLRIRIGIVIGGGGFAPAPFSQTYWQNITKLWQNINQTWN